MKSDVINKPSHSPQPKLSTYPPLTLPSRSYGTVPYSRNFLFPSRRPQSFSLTTKPRFQSHTTRNFTPARSKHININLHFLRDLASQGILTIYVNTHDNLADLFTKGLPRQRHEDLTYRIGVLSGHGGVLKLSTVRAPRCQCAGLCARPALV